MKKLLAIISLFALVLTSCEKEETMPVGSGLETLVATIENAADTKATLQDGTNGNVVVWENNDKISVFVQQGNTVTNVQYVLNSGKGTTEGIFIEADTDFELAADATVLAAVYPYTEGATYSGGTISGLSTSSTYTYSSTEKVGPMAAKANGTALAFKNAGSLVKVSTSNIPAGYTSIELSSATSNLSGSYSIALDANGVPAATLTGDSKSITFNGTSTDQTVYFPIFAGTYTDLTIKAKGEGKGDLTLISPKALTAAKNYIYYTNASATTNTSGTVSLGANDNKNMVISTDATNLSVSQESGATITGNVNIAIDGGSTSRTLDIDLPQATVELSGTTTYTSITAATAENTLILGNGVTAEKVIVKQGNVQVNAGSTLKGIELNGTTSSAIIINNGGNLENIGTLPEGVKIMTPAEYELSKAIAAGGTVTLADAVNLSGTITISNDLELDLGGKTLTIKGNISYGLINKANLTIKNGTIIFEGDGSNGAAVCNMNQITMESANITSNTVCFRNWGDTGVTKLEGKTVADANVTATINGGTFNSTFINNEQHSQHRYAIHGYFLSNMTMTGSTITGSGGISVDVSFATLTNVTATAECTYGAHGLYVASGNATVSGCTITNAAAYSDDTYGKAVVKIGNNESVTYPNGTTVININ